MRALKQFVVAATLMAACVVAGGSAALARDRDGGFRGEGHHAWSGSHPHGFSRDQKVGWHSWAPHGWLKGRKTGWGGGGRGGGAGGGATGGAAEDNQTRT